MEGKEKEGEGKRDLFEWKKEERRKRRRRRFHSLLVAAVGGVCGIFPFWLASR